MAVPLSPPFSSLEGVRTSKWCLVKCSPTACQARGGQQWSRQERTHSRRNCSHTGLAVLPTGSSCLGREYWYHKLSRQRHSYNSFLANEDGKARREDSMLCQNPRCVNFLMAYGRFMHPIQISGWFNRASRLLDVDDSESCNLSSYLYQFEKNGRHF